MQKLILFVLIAFVGFSSSSWAQLSLNKAAEESTYRIVKEKEIQHIIDVSEKNICNLNWLESQEWADFKAELQSEEMKHLPLNEFKAAFNQKRKALPFTHFYLRSSNPKPSGASQKEAEPAFELKTLNAKTALLTIRSFIADAPGMIKIVQQIQAGGYENLVIDLRENTGGTLDAAVVLGRFITNEAIDAGVYLTRKWFLNHESYPTKDEIQNMPFLKDMTYDGTMKAYAENEAFRMVLPPHNNPTFKGKIAVLTSNITGSTCEPFVDLLKKKNLATIVGGKTGGGMLSGAYFKINSDLKLFLPIADYLTDEGTRIDKVGIEPNVSVHPDQALDYVLENVF